MKYEIFHNYCFVNGKWHHMVRMLNTTGAIVTQLMTYDSRLIQRLISEGE